MSPATLRRLVRSRHFAWLLALALWLPAAQWVAATHALLHLHASVSGDTDAAAHLPAACETCVVAAALGGAAPGPAEPLAPLLAAASRSPQLRDAPQRPASPPAAYRSRAPPALHA